MRLVVRRAVRMLLLTIVLAWMFLLSAVIAAASQATAAEPPNSDDVVLARPAPKLEQRRDTPQTTVDAVSTTVMCPTCDTTLDQSDSPAAQRMRVYVEAAVAAGWTQDEIHDGLVAEYGGDEAILAVPRAQGIGMLVWVVPAVVALAAVLVAALVLRRWRRDRVDREQGAAA